MDGTLLEVMQDIDMNIYKSPVKQGRKSGWERFHENTPEIDGTPQKIRETSNLHSVQRKKSMNCPLSPDSFDSYSSGSASKKETDKDKSGTRKSIETRL